VKDPRDVIFKPVVSEKSYSLLDANTYTFIVHPDANKTEIKEAVQSIFSVRVTNVNTLHRKGKRKRTRRQSGVIVGQRKATKRALVTLHPDDKIELFEAR
jgi:large subunit ribosomal protein L23